MISSAYFYYNCFILARIAEILGQAKDAQHYIHLAECIKEAFNQRFFNAAEAMYATGSQGCNTLLLFLPLARKPQGAGETALLFARNKWLLVHPEAENLVRDGAFVGIRRKNLKIKAIG